MATGVRARARRLRDLRRERSPHLSPGSPCFESRASSAPSSRPSLQLGVAAGAHRGKPPGHVPASAPARIFSRRFYRPFRPIFLTFEADELVEYGKDWTKVFPPAPSAVAFPRTTDEVSELLRLCTAHRVAVVPSGGRTGLAGGAVAAQGELVLSLARMRRMDPVDDWARRCACRRAPSPRRCTSTARRRGSPGRSTSRPRARARWAATSPPTPAA